MGLFDQVKNNRRLIWFFQHQYQTLNSGASKETGETKVPSDSYASSTNHDAGLDDFGLTNLEIPVMPMLQYRHCEYCPWQVYPCMIIYSVLK